MNAIPLRPYPGTLFVCKKRKEFKKQYKKLFRNNEHNLTKSKRGRMVGRYDEKHRCPTYLVFAEDAAALAHEISHVVFSVFDAAGIPTNIENDETFCYFLDHLFSEAYKNENFA